MFPLSKTLLPVDFSPRMLGAAHYAKTLACRFRSELTMLHVLKPFGYPAGGVEMAPMVGRDWYDNRLEDSRRHLNAFLVDEFGSLPVKRTVLDGDPAAEIVRFAHSERSDLIVMPTHGYGPFRRFLLGSVTAKVLHDADCPVLTGVHIAEASPAEAIFFRTILCAVDLGPQSERALAWAAKLAGEFNANLAIVHALPPLEVGEAQYFDPDFRIMLARRAKEQIEEVQRKLGTTAEVILDYGDAPEAVHSAAQARHADLVVIGRHADSGILGRLRANAYEIIRESPCPVVSV
jgi:nucleotide-binding universal stress UspA family protein